MSGLDCYIIGAELRRGVEMRILALFIVLAHSACGSNDSESKEVPKNALCKTLKDGSVQRYEIAPEEKALREVMAGMGFVPCE